MNGGFFWIWRYISRYIFYFFLGDITGYPRFLMDAPIVCGVPIHVASCWSRFTWRFSNSWGYHGVPVNHPVEIGIFHYKLSSYWGSHFGKSPYELRDSPASLGRKPPSMWNSQASWARWVWVINHGICGYPYQTKPLGSKTRCGFSDPDGGIPTCLMMCQAFARTAVRLRLNGMARARPSLNTAFASL
jgi:hypothetical protein